MRNLRPRNDISKSLEIQLQKKTDEILKLPEGDARRKTAKRVYDNSRKAQWFKPVMETLLGLCGGVEVCMYCSSNEPSQIEHYRPKAVFPELAMVYDNYLWTCSICNGSKLDRFPPDTEAGEQILNPIDDSVWEYFTFDHFGNLTPLLSSNGEDFLSRAISTCEVVKIDREFLQKRRRRRYSSYVKDLKRSLKDLDEGSITIENLLSDIQDIRTDDFQADVADYFLNGPGRVNEPFRSALIAIGEEVSTEV